ncbi:DUF2961 domain-containing protein [bacterium]|nr:DUF2961 domain-containing protein [bacterium]
MIYDDAKEKQPGKTGTVLSIWISLVILAVLSGCSGSGNKGDGSTGRPELYARQPHMQSRWASFENPTAEKGKAGLENKGAKGHAFDSIAPGETKVLLDVRGAGIVNRIWMTMNPRSPELLRSLRIEMFWDDAPTPAVSAPLGDFFCHILGRGVSVDNELFSNPNGNAFNCYIPMPFKKAARIVVVNDSETTFIQFYYDVDINLTDRPDENALYFHAYWRRERWTKLGEDYEILPPVKGEGRYLGAHVGVITRPDNIGWWGEGGLKIYLDGDSEHPTMMGTGTEDYMGAAWGMPVFKSRYQGCLITDNEHGFHAFYRYHIPDPVYFHQDCRVTMQQIGCTHRETALSLMEKGVPFKAHSIFYVGKAGTKFVRLLDMDPVPDIKDITMPEGYDQEYIFYYRTDDWSSVVFFYLDSPENGLPPMAGRDDRTTGIEGSIPLQ